MIGNLFCTVLEGFKSNHRCNVYCIALELPGEYMHASFEPGSNLPIVYSYETNGP